jgi:hypothetical protein
MGRTLLFITALTLLGVTALAAMGSLITSFPNRGASTHFGMAADAEYLYSFHYDVNAGYPIVVLRKANGTFVRSLQVPLPIWQRQSFRGVGYEGDGSVGLGYLYLNNYSGRFVAKVRIANGKLVSTWGWVGGTYRYGLCCENDKTKPDPLRGFYQNNFNGIWWRSDRNGSLISSWRLPYSNFAYDLTWDYVNGLIWYANYSTLWVFGMTPAGSIKESWRLRAGVSAPYGIAYYERRLYVSTSGGSPDEYVWVYDCPVSTVGIRPASLGKVKVLFK